MQQTLLVKFAVVFLYQGITAVLPLVFAMMTNDPKWVVLVPILRAVWQTLEKYLTDQQLLGGTSNGVQNQVWH